jgi:uncharacterized membrane protein (UPF0127 family)
VEIRADTSLLVAGGLSQYSFVIKAEVADTEDKRAPGLSGRRALMPGYGMLYVFDEPEKPTFSEARTAFPLTTAFLRADGTIALLHVTTARDPVPFSCEEAVPFVLQVRAGWFRDRGIKEGDRLVLPPEAYGMPALEELLPDPRHVPEDTPRQVDAPILG